jgi:ectoine hydroxylase-related dioxygenase (phytanoyl-CoA dioxygenase family)
MVHQMNDLEQSPEWKSAADATVTDALHRDGALVFRNVVDADLRRRIAVAIERDMRDPGPFFHNYQVEKGRFHGNSLCWLRHTELADCVFDSSLPELAARLLRASKVNLLYDQLFIKEPGTDTPTPWHHDHCVWPLKGDDVLSFWLALDSVDATNGRVEFVRGSHRWEGLFQPHSFTNSAISYPIDPRFRPMPDIDGDRQRYDIVTWDMEPGDVVAFYSRTVHGAGGNGTTARRRRGYTVRYCGDSVTYDTSYKFMPALTNPDLHHGDPLDSDMFPIVWQNGKPAGRPSSRAVERLLTLASERLAVPSATQ